jgi:hypothetical protein
MNKTISLLNTIIEIINRCFKFIIIICIIIYLIIYYQSQSNNRYQYHSVDWNDCKGMIFDSRTGDIIGFKSDEEGKSKGWVKITPLKELK